MKRLTKITIILILTGIIFYSLLWIFSWTRYPIAFGISFDGRRAEYLGLEWKTAYKEILNELQPAFIRVSAPWEYIEYEKGVYFFDDTDYLMDGALEAGTQVTLVIGQKAPRWPECYIPSWVGDAGTHARREQFFAYIEAVVERYKNHPALELWQIENEPFIHFRFGECERFDRNIVKDEVALVRSLDPDKKIVITDSGELATWYGASKYGDVIGTTLYRTVRADSGLTLSYFMIPPGYYKMRAAMFGRNPDTFFVSELQAEPWFIDPSLEGMKNEKLDSTLSLEKFDKNIDYASRAGVSRAYLWGAEWWYWLKETQHDDSYWNKAKEALTKSAL